MKKFLPYLRYLRPVAGLFIIGVILGLLYGISSGFGLPFMIHKVFPIIFSTTNTQLTSAALLFYCSLPPAIFLVRGLCGYFNTVLITYCSTRVLESIRLDIFAKIQILQLGFFARNTTGDILARVDGDARVLQATLTELSNNVIKHPITLVSAVAVLIYLSVVHEEVIFLLFCLSSVPCCVFPIRYIAKKLLRRSREITKLNGELAQTVTENLLAVKDVRAFCLEKQQVDRLKRITQQIIRIQTKLVKYSSALSPSIECVSALGISVTLYFAYKNNVPLDVFITLVSALYFSYSPIKALGKIHARVKNGQASLERLEYILNAPVATTDPKNPKEIDRIEGAVSFQNVTFAYDEIPALKNVNFFVEPGTTIALVGPSGAGKSTVSNLIMRFYDVDKGKVTIDRIDVRDLRKNKLRKNIALVPQDPFLFNDTIYNNILIGNPEASEEMVYEAARNAYAHDFITKQPNGYHTVIGDRGSALSGGQRQRLAIARAFLRGAPILILDEATSALDSESENMVQRALEHLVQDKTVFIIAHRFSTLRLADRIMTFDKGQLISEGPHNEVYLTCPVYKNLYDRQNPTTPDLAVV